MKTKYIQIFGLIFCLLIVFVVIFYHSGLLPTEIEEILGIDESRLNTDASDEYDPLGDIQYINIQDTGEINYDFDYDEYIKKYYSATYLSESGYRLTSEGYDEGSVKLALVLSDLHFPEEYSLTEHTIEKTVTTEGKKGGTYTEYKEVTEACAVLRPYYGYVIYTSDTDVMLLDSSCKTIVKDFKGYEPAYMTTAGGEPLFIKDGKYYFFYDGESVTDIVYDDINGETYAEDYIETPTAYQYFSFDTYLLLNYYASGFTDNSYYLSEMIMSLPEKAGMVEYLVDGDLHTELKTPVYNYGESKCELYPFYTRVASYEVSNPDEVASGSKARYKINAEQILWGYMDVNGNTVVVPKYKAAYGFNNDGYAVVLDLDDHLCIINQNGNIVYNAYTNIYYFTQLSDKKIRDGFYTPDTYGIESLGMFYFDTGYLRVRRMLVDTAYGYIVKRETQVIVTPEGSTLNYPEDYNLVSYSDGMLLLERDGVYGYMDTAGDWIIKPGLVYAQPFCEGLAVVGYSSDKLGVIDTRGNLVMPCMYDKIENCSGGIITAYKFGKGWTVYSKMTASAETEAILDPTIALKKRSIAEAQYKYYYN